VELGRPKAEVARDFGVSRRWVHELVKRYEAGGEAALEPRSRRPLSSPHHVPIALEDEIVELRKALSEQGLDAGAHTIAFHLDRRHGASPAPSTIWRVLTRRGFVTPQPQKRPRSSFIRFEADQPNERWQADVTHWALAGGTECEILNIVDDHSRLCVASDVRMVTKGGDVVASFHPAAAAHGFPASVLTDNAAVFAGAPRGGGRCAIEVELDSLGIAHRHSSPYHPQTCGKVERFHQTEKRWLAKQEAATDARSLQSQLDRFRPTTTPCDPTERCDEGRRSRPSRPGRRPRHHVRGSSFPCTTGSAETASTPPGRSRSATRAGSCISGSDDATPAVAYSS
jgi:transposase InsO family protein